MSITTLTNLSLNNQYYLEVISRLKNRRQTRNTTKLIDKYQTSIRNNLYDQLRILTEIYYKTQYYNLFNHFKILNKFKRCLLSNPHISNPITDQEKYIIKAFYDTIY